MRVILSGDFKDESKIEFLDTFRIYFRQLLSLRVNTTACLQKSRRRGKPTGGIGNLRSFVKIPEKGSDGPRKAIRKNSSARASKSFNPFKSPSPNGIYPVLLQRAGDPIIEPLVRLARASLTLSYVPKAWRGTRVILIPRTDGLPRRISDQSALLL